MLKDNVLLNEFQKLDRIYELCENASDARYSSWKWTFKIRSIRSRSKTNRLKRTVSDLALKIASCSPKTRNKIFSCKDLSYSKQNMSRISSNVNNGKKC